MNPKDKLKKMSYQKLFILFILWQRLPNGSPWQVNHFDVNTMKMCRAIGTKQLKVLNINGQPFFFECIKGLEKK